MKKEEKKLWPNGNVLPRFRILLAVYDFLGYVAVALLFSVLYTGLRDTIDTPRLLLGLFVGWVLITASRCVLGIYHRVWRYGGMGPFGRLIVADVIGSILFILIDCFLIKSGLTVSATISLVAVVSMVAQFSRIAYYYIYHFASHPTPAGAFWRWVLSAACGVSVNRDSAEEMTANTRKIRAAVFGAGRVGIGLAQEMMENPRSAYVPVCFIDISKEKVGRRILDLPVLMDEEASKKTLDRLGVQEIIFTLPPLEPTVKKEIYTRYKDAGFSVKVYDYPVTQNALAKKRTLRDFDIEELLLRPAVSFKLDSMEAHYRDKVVMVTGGGGSIGSELCRQIARMQPKELVIVDVCENGAYDIQQELKGGYGDDLNLAVEIVSVCDRSGLEQLFARHQPDVVLHAAAHKHVPLMERNCCEAVKNNVFGTLNTAELAMKYGARRFIMVSTDKAVNPTNVMGATKRMCEMIVQSFSTQAEKTVFSATRFGNVLGSAGSVIPLFRRQIANGGPVTLTDKRIIRYFMTIPEASQLVLQSGTMAKRGELFVLDMGKPVKIAEMAENMIRLSGYEPYRDIDIVETGLRPGEKLYEELLIRSEELDRTENNLIFIERDEPLPLEELNRRLAILQDAVNIGDDDAVRDALHQTVPTFRTPEEVNARAVLEWEKETEPETAQN